MRPLFPRVPSASQAPPNYREPTESANPRYGISLIDALKKLLAAGEIDNEQACRILHERGSGAEEELEAIARVVDMMCRGTQRIGVWDEESEGKEVPLAQLVGSDAEQPNTAVGSNARSPSRSRGAHWQSVS